jgi:hypothetical protein
VHDCVHREIKENLETANESKRSKHPRPRRSRRRPGGRDCRGSDSAKANPLQRIASRATVGVAARTIGRTRCCEPGVALGRLHGGGRARSTRALATWHARSQGRGRAALRVGSARRSRCYSRTSSAQARPSTLRGPDGARDEFIRAATSQNLRKMAKLIPMPTLGPASQLIRA